MPWSYSRLKTYEQCNAKYDYRYNLKIPDSFKSDAAERGVNIHKNIENAVKGGLSRTIEHGLIEPHLTDYEKSGIVVQPEANLKLDREWKQVITGEHWLLAILDLLARVGETQAVGWDWKTGKVYPEHAEQSHLYAMTVLSAYPEIEKVTMKFAYLDQGFIRSAEYSRHELEEGQRLWNARVARMETAEAFAPNPQFLCRYCSYAKTKSGPCRFG